MNREAGSRPGLPAGALLIALLAGSSPGAGAAIPQGAAGAAEDPRPAVVSPAAEVLLGEEALQRFLSARPLSEDGNLALRVNRIGQAVARTSDRPDLVYSFYVVQGPELQAYSFIGGTVALTERLARLLDDDELAFALAHELTHIALRHHISRVLFERALALSGPGQAGTEPALGFYGRTAELEADRFGALYAVRAGFRFSAAHGSLARLEQASPARDSDANHPSYAERIEELRHFQKELERCVGAFERGRDALRTGRAGEAVSLLTVFVASFPNSASGRVNLGAAYLARVRSRSGTPGELSEELPILPEAGVALRGSLDVVDVERAIGNFEEALRLHPGNVPARAGIALAFTRLARYEEARRLLLEVSEEESWRAEALLDLGNVEFLAGEPAKAEVFYRLALQARDGWPPARRNLALALERAGRAEEARALWAGLVSDPLFGAEAAKRLGPAPAAPP